MKTEVMYFPRELVDRGLKEGPGAWMLFCVVLEKTYGDGRVSAEISIQEFVDVTTLTEKQVQKALDKLYYSGIIRVFGGPNRGTFMFSFKDAVRDGILPAPSPVSVEEV
jgi:hypothetical protein